VSQDERFISMVLDAVRSTVAAIRDAHPSETLSGYALCTDDSLSTLSHIACTHEFIDAHRAAFPDVDVIAVAWEYAEGSDAFDGARALLTEKYAAVAGNEELFERHVSEVFGALLIVLRRARDEGLFQDDVLVYATSTDPGPALEELALNGVIALNTPSWIERWRAAMGS